MAKNTCTNPAQARFQWLIPISLVLIALTIRIVYLNQLTAMPTFQHPIMDEQYHIELAQKINSPQGYGSEPFFRAPLYPFFFAQIYKLTHHSLYWSRFIQILLGSLLPLIVYVLGLRFFTRSIGMAAALIASIYPTFIYHDVTILITSMKTLLAALVVLQLYRTGNNLRRHDFALSGILLGLATLARPNFAILGLTLIIWIWIVVVPRIGLKSALVRYGIILGCIAGVTAPVTIRNFVASGDFVPVAWQGGFNFFLGNNRLANGWSATVPGLDYTWDGGYRDAISIAETRSGKPLKRSEVSDFWYDQGWTEVKADPAHFFGLVVKKLRLFFTGYEIPNNEDMYVVRRFSSVMAPLMFAGAIKFPYGLLAPLALIGIAFGLRRWRDFLLIYLFMASYIASFLLFFVCARYRQPIIPFMILFAAYGVVKILEWIRQKAIGRLAVVLFSFIALVVFSNYDRLGLDSGRTEAEDNFMFGNVYLDQGELDRSAEYFRKAIASDSTFAPPYVNLGIVYSRIRLFEDARTAFATAIRLEPQTIDAYYNLAAMLMSNGDLAAGVAWLEQGRDVNPLNAYVHSKLASAYFEQHRFDEARRSADEALRLDPSLEPARNLLRELKRVEDSTQAR